MSHPLQENQPQADVPELESEIERALLRAYIDSANDGIFVVCDEMKFHVANPLMVEWIGVDEAELTAHGRRRPITELFGLVRPKRCSANISKLRSTARQPTLK